MPENNELLKALGQVPELVETTRNVLEDNDKKFRLLAELVQKRVEAVIPASEVTKLTSSVSSAVENTECATPDVSEISTKVAQSIVGHLQSVVRVSTVEAVKEAVKDTPVTVEHIHSHTTLREMTEMADKTLRNWIIGALLYNLLLTFCAALALVYYFNSEEYWGKKYAEIYFSEYVTKDEKEFLIKDCYDISFISDEFKKNPQRIKEKIKHNKEIIRERKAEAARQKGRFSTEKSVER